MSNTSQKPMTQKEELEHLVHRVVQFIMDDPEIRRATDSYARTTLNNWGLTIPSDITDFEPYWSLVTEYGTAICAMVTVRASSQIGRASNR